MAVFLSIHPSHADSPEHGLISLKSGIYKINVGEPTLTLSAPAKPAPSVDPEPIQYAIVSKEPTIKKQCDNSTCHNKIFFLTNHKSFNYKMCMGYQNNYALFGESKNFCSGDKYIHKKVNNEIKRTLTYNTDHSFELNIPDKTYKFSLLTAKPYNYSLYLNQAIPLYMSPQTNANKHLLDKNTYVAILTKQPDWYEVDYYNKDNQPEHGWINRNDLIQNDWIPQLDKTNDFSFESALYNEGDTDNLMMIRIIDRHNHKIVQIIRDLQTDISRPSDAMLDDGTMAMEHVVHIEDVNFDGYPDIVTHSAADGSQIHGPIGVFLYQPKQHRFMVSDLLSFTDEITVDKKHKTVDCVSWSGKTDRNEYKYKFVNSKPILIYSSEISWNQDQGENRIGQLRNGKMHYKTIPAK